MHPTFPGAIEALKGCSEIHPQTRILPVREVTGVCTPRRPGPAVWYQSYRQDGEAQVQRTEHHQPL